MGRVIKLVIYYFLYNFVFMGVVFGVYGFINHSADMPQSGPVYFNLSMWVQLLATLAVGIHLLAWKYVTRKDLRLDFPHTAKVLLVSVVLIVGMGCWTNYLTELTELPDVMEDLFAQAMNNPLGIISIVILAPIVEELLIRGGMQDVGDSRTCPCFRSHTRKSCPKLLRFHSGTGVRLGILPHRKPVALHVDALYQ